jgi:hypothetical protein
MATQFAPTISDTDSTHTYIHNRNLLIGARLAWVLCFAISIAIAIAHTPYYFVGIRDQIQTLPQWILIDIGRHGDLWRTGLVQLNVAPEIPALILVTVFRIGEFTGLAVSLLIFVYRSDNWMALWVSFAIGLVGIGSGAYLVLYSLPAGNWFFALYSLTLILTAIIVLYLLPDGHFYPSYLRWVILVYVLWELFRHSQVALQTELFRTTLPILWYAPLVVVFCIGVIAQSFRYRRANSVARHQVKWMLLGIAIYFVTYLLFFVRVLLSETIAANSTGAGYIIFQVFMTALNPIGAMSMAVCIGLAVTRYRLYDVNIAINRSLVYGVVTLVMAVVFLGVGFLLQSILGREQSGIAFLLSIFVAGLLFNPARKRVQRFIDRRFYGFRFDLYQVRRAQRLPEIKNPGALTGTMLGKYKVLGVIGRGGMGEVYQGWDEERTVALKILPAEFAAKPDLLKRFQREARTLSTFDHPHIVKIYDSGQSEAVYYMAMELVEGRELSEVIKQRGALPFEEVRQFVQNFAAALDYAHQRGLVHRDIKPSNIMLRMQTDHETEEVVLMDFGVAKIQDGTSITGTGAIGTIGYMAPEQIIAAKEVDHRADIYALGVVLYEMLTGERPFKCNPGQVLFAHLQQPVPNPREVNQAIPVQAAYVVMKALSKDPNDRFQSVGELAAALVV